MTKGQANAVIFFLFVIAFSIYIIAMNIATFTLAFAGKGVVF